MTRFGILTPVFSLVPGNHAAWEVEAGIDEVVRVVEAADRLGFDYVTCSEHVAMPAAGTEPLAGPRYWDPLASLSFLAAHTARIRLATSVLVLPYHHPLAIAKQFGTLDRLSGGRLILGVGVGYLEEEFAVLGVPYPDRGARTDDAIGALRAAFGRRTPEYHGTYYQFSDVVVDPCGVQEHPPIWVGGRTQRSLRRAVELGDGWCPFAVSTSDVARWLARAAEGEAWASRSAPLDVVMSRGPLDPMGNPDKTITALNRAVEAGATTISLRFDHNSVEQCVEQLEAMAELVADDLHGADTVDVLDRRARST